MTNIRDKHKQMPLPRTRNLVLRRQSGYRLGSEPVKMIFNSTLTVIIIIISPVRPTTAQRPPPILPLLSIRGIQGPVHQEVVQFIPPHRRLGHPSRLFELVRLHLVVILAHN